MNRILILGLVLTCFVSVAKSNENKYNYVVKFHEDGLLTYQGGVNKLAATAPKKQGSSAKFLAKSAEALAYSAYLKDVKTERMNEISQVLSREAKSMYHYKAVYHGVMMELTATEAQQLRSLNNIKSVEQEPVHFLDTERGPRWINADQVWDGTAVPITSLPNKGEGMIVGIIDTGINSGHPSFAGTGPVDGYVHTNPYGAGNYVGHCIGGDNDGNPPPFAEIPCNNKLIGAWGFENDGTAPEDGGGHGSHTASTVAGNVWDGPFYDSAAGSTIALDQISGVAPHANIIAYDVCGETSCATVSAGVDRAIQDGVDVINFSISGGTNPWNDTDRMFLDAVNAGIFVAASAGNTRATNTNPIADVSHKGPWVMTVAASTHDRDGTRLIGDFTGGDTSITQNNLLGQSNTGGYGPAPIVYAGDYSNGDPDPEQCLNPFPAGTWTNGEIVVCDRGAIARVLKGANVAEGGAAGFVLANVDPDPAANTLAADFHVIPGIHVKVISGNILKNWISTGSGHMARIKNNTGGGNPAVGDILAGFSLRGPNLTFDVNKPSITAPGVTVAAAVNADVGTPNGAAEIGFLSGTSMSSPHTAGAAALMRAVHPDWTVSEIKSAMQMTADLTGRKEDNATPVDTDDVGTGRVDLANAPNAGFVMDETFANYLAADPGNGGDPKTLNLPSARNSFCGTSCSWTRTLTPKLAADASWTVTTSTDDPAWNLTVTPDSFDSVNVDQIFVDGLEGVTFVPASDQTITITAAGTIPLTTDGMSFGTVTISDDSGNSPDLVITVAVNQALPYGGVPPLD
ncbi:S8 family serine peptidase [Marinicella litoralis]|uniref:Peptidase inhibitor I9 n=1 Tax=Marinicella litoralis TaxID=644220 RepID=A0A4R6XB18_9GAMM|nr:S8 family serine peptidase [Marinicella litoralis]TDR16356.1 peptidase inhibitor I9 [Marinicella litoralis]